MERLGDDVRRGLAAAGGSAAPALARIVEAWPGAVGDAIARAAWPSRLGRDGTLHVAAASSTWAFELGRLADEIAARLAAALGEDAPAALRFAPGRVPEPPAPAGAEQSPDRPDPGPAERAGAWPAALVRTASASSPSTAGTDAGTLGSAAATWLSWFFTRSLIWRALRRSLDALCMSWTAFATFSSWRSMTAWTAVPAPPIVAAMRTREAPRADGPTLRTGRAG